ncbi:hypothetical protein D3C76_1501630 [compost metagenome]
MLTGEIRLQVQPFKFNAPTQAGKLRLVAGRQGVEEGFGTFDGLTPIQAHQGAHHAAIAWFDLARLQQQRFSRDFIGFGQGDIGEADQWVGGVGLEGSRLLICLACRRVVLTLQGFVALLQDHPVAGNGL